VFENRVLRRIFGPKMEEVTREYRKHNEEFNGIYTSSKLFRVNEPGKTRSGHAAHIGEMRASYWVLVW
jgi:hypothetical protein